MQFLKQLLEMSPSDYTDVCNMIDYMFKEYGVKIMRSGRTHFPYRAAGERDDPTKQEVIAAFSKMKQKYGPLIKQYRDNNKELLAVLQDMSSDLNIVFSIHFQDRIGRNDKYPLYGITIKRKDPNEFYVTSRGGREFRVEGVQDIVPYGKEDYVDLPNSNKKKKKKKPAPTTDKAENSLINTLWFYNNADAS